MITLDSFRSLLLLSLVIFPINLRQAFSYKLTKDQFICIPAPLQTGSVLSQHDSAYVLLLSVQNLTQIIPHSTIPKYRLMGCSLQMSTFLSHINFHPSHYFAHNPFHQCGSPLHHSSCLLTTPSKSSPSTIHHSIPLYLQTPYLPTWNTPPPFPSLPSQS